MSSSDKCLQETSVPGDDHKQELLFKQMINVPDDDDDECWADAKTLLDNDNDDDDGNGNGNNREQDKTFNFNNSSEFKTSDDYKLAQIDSNFDELILHKAIFHNDTRLALSLLNDTDLLQQKDLVNKKDKHGNTALHLACILGRSKEIISAFLDNSTVKWSIDIRNINRWTPFHEACSFGNREIVKLMAKQIKDDVEDALNNKKLSSFLERTKNYRLVLKWEFQSWVPFVARVLPSDVCVITKQGKFLRIDTRLLDFEGLFRKKGDSCLVYSNGKWIVMNNKLKKYQYFETPNVYKDRDIEDKVDEFMSMDIMDLELKSSEMQLTRSTSGWIWKNEKIGKVGRFNAALYDFTNVYLVTRKRREHLSEEDLKRNKSAYKNAVYAFKFGERPPLPPPPPLPNTSKRGTVMKREAGNNRDDMSEDVDDTLSRANSQDDEEEPIFHRESLPLPPPTNVSWDQYIRSEPGQYPNIGREQMFKTTRTAVRASVAMSEEFPLTKNEFLDLLSVVPIKLFKKLKEFVEMKLPDGFPVRLDIPVFPALTARITFEDFTFLEETTDESLFTIPPDYERDPNLLPGRFRADAANIDEDNLSSNGET